MPCMHATDIGGGGHQFESRFKAKLVEDDTYLLALTRYIHLNPIKIAACRHLARSERVRLLENYCWSSLCEASDGVRLLQHTEDV